MHSYATNSNERYTVTPVLALLGLGSAWLIEVTLRSLGYGIPWWLEDPSPLALFAIYWRVFQQWGWRWQILRSLGIVRIPIVSGCWNGHVTTSFDQHAAQHPVTVEIRQSWTKMVIRLESESSRSVSIVAALLTDENPEGAQLLYQYRNEPRVGAVGTMQTHQGTARLFLNASGSLFDGDYYSGRGRSNVGTVRLERTPPANS